MIILLTISFVISVVIVALGFKQIVKANQTEDNARLIVGIALAAVGTFIAALLGQALV